MTSNTLKWVDMLLQISDYQAFRISITDFRNVLLNTTLRKSQDLGVGKDRYDELRCDFTLSHSMQDSRFARVSLIQTY